jgi:Protein of unknown function (DUF2806)
MADGTSLINIGELSKPATVLVEKVCNAVGIVFEPTRIVRQANAEAKAEIIKAKASVEIRNIEHRAIDRFIHQETRKQENIESITFQAASSLTNDAKVELLDEDWVAHFFNHCENVSDKEMQSLWSRLLAGEASKPNTFSKRTVQFISTIDKKDAELFTRFCQFAWNFGELVPFITDYLNNIYTNEDINFESLLHLEAIGLIAFDGNGRYANQGLLKEHVVQYHDNLYTIKFNKESDNSLDIGKALFTSIGRELFNIANPKKNEVFHQYVLQEWAKQTEFTVV